MGQDCWSESAQKFYGKAAQLKGDPGYYRTFSRAYRKVADILAVSPQSSLLDVGCGCGEMAQALQGQIGLYCGIDISWDSLVIAREQNADSVFVCADMTVLPLSAQFDLIAAMTSLEMVFDKPAALREINRALQDSGKLYAEVRNADFLLFKLFSPFMEHFMRWRLVVPYEAEGFRDLGFEEWNDLLTEAGFQIIELKKSLRPAMYGSLMTRAKNTLIKIIRFITPIKYHYMVGFLCVKQ